MTERGFICFIYDQSGKTFFGRFGPKNISDLPEAKLKPEHYWKLTRTKLPGVWPPENLHLCSQHLHGIQIQMDSTASRICSFTQKTGISLANDSPGISLEQALNTNPAPQLA